MLPSKTILLGLKKYANPLWLTVLVCIVGMYSLAIYQHTNAFLTGSKVKVSNIDGARNMITKELVQSRLNAYFGTDIKSKRIQTVQLTLLEQNLKADSRIEETDIFINAQHELCINIVQRKPIARVISDRKENYYIDAAGNRIYPIDGVSLRLPIITGNIDDYRPDWAKDPKHILNDLIQVAVAMEGDFFFQKFVSQIDVDKSKDIVLISKIGNQKIRIGDAKDLKIKLENIKETYKVMNWQKYDELDFKITNQVVGRS